MPDKSVICIGDGDSIGDVIELCLLSSNLNEASKFSQSVKIALEDIASSASKEFNAELVYVAGDDICFSLSGKFDIKKILTSYADFFFHKTGKTMSFGAGETSTEAIMNLRIAKVSGKGCVVFNRGTES